MRTCDIFRRTLETDIRVTLSLDGGGMCDIRTGVGFLDHMLTLFAHHGGFDGLGVVHLGSGAQEDVPGISACLFGGFVHFRPNAGNIFRDMLHISARPFLRIDVWLPR